MTTALLVGAAAPPAVVQAAQAAPGTAAQPVIVVLDGDVDATQVAAEHSQASGVTPEFVYRSALKGYAAVLPTARIEELREDPRVAYVQPDTKTMTLLPDATADLPPQPVQSVSNGVRRIGALESPAARIDGRDERVDVDLAIIDSGIQPDHPDLDVVGGVDCAPGDGWSDRDGHGTFVSGLAAAIDNEIGRVGVAPGARLWAVRVGGTNGVVRDSWLLCGLEWTTANADVVEVANLSLSGPLQGTDVDCAPPNRNAVLAAVCAATAAGVTVVSAAGNGAVDASRSEPAAFDASIAVSAMADSDGLPGGTGPPVRCLPGEVDDTFASFSNFGEPVDLAAPGVCTSSTFIGSTYAVSAGTSFAAPLVTGAAALYLAGEPDATPEQVRAALIEDGEPGPLLGDPDDYPEPVVHVSQYGQPEGEEAAGTSPD